MFVFSTPIHPCGFWPYGVELFPGGILNRLDCWSAPAAKPFTVRKFGFFLG